MGQPLRHAEDRRPRERPPSPEDEAQARATEAAAASLGAMLETIGIQRPIASITWGELNRLAIAAVSGWVIARSQQGIMEDTKPADVPPFMGG
ncbi:hypothetical protein UFOVP452_51 [uncultured Caudovirales phage]|uniref:Uncharacterized protein n=1 Tax=uncultured Caudovirales phage TaxID=2100421 RepID=A0A6J5MD61_9CAUD|nr:hypothetical protein UFOVP452_51 [uncultured Caudovirales phage]